MTAANGPCGKTKSKAPYLFYRGHVEVKELKPTSQYFRQGAEIISHAHPHMVHQKRSHWPNHNDRQTEDGCTSCALTKGIPEVDPILPRQH